MALKTDWVFFLKGRIMMATLKEISSDRGTTTAVYTRVFQAAL